MMTPLLERLTNRSRGLVSGYSSLRTLRQRLAGKVTCLLYHRVVQDGDRSWIERGGVPATIPAAFQSHLAILREMRCRFFTLRQLANGEFPNPDEPGVVITFDDGFADNFRIAQPILDALRIPAVFFVATGLVDGDSCNWDHQVCWHLNQPNASRFAERRVTEMIGSVGVTQSLAWRCRHLLTQDQINEVMKQLNQQFGSVPGPEFRGLYSDWNDLQSASTAGHEIGSHTVNHLMRHTLTESEFEQELRASKRRLESQLQVAVNSFSFPFNSFLFSDFALCQKVGYTATATVEPGRVTPKVSLLEIPRRSVFRIHNSSPEFCDLLTQERWV